MGRFQDCALAEMERRELHHPAVQGGVVNRDAALENFFKITVGHGVAEVEEYRVQDHRLRIVHALEFDHVNNLSPTHSAVPATTPIEVTIPPPSNATLSRNAAIDPTVRDRHIAEIAACGRMAWQIATGYNQRSRAKTVMGGRKTAIGPKVRALTFENQKTEAKSGVRVLNRMTGLAVQVLNVPLKFRLGWARCELQLICATRPRRVGSLTSLLGFGRRAA